MIKKIAVDIEEYVDLRQQSKELENILDLIFANSRTVDKNLLYLASDNSLMSYLKIVENDRYLEQLEELKELKKGGITMGIPVLILRRIRFRKKL